MKNTLGNLAIFILNFKYNSCNEERCVDSTIFAHQGICVYAV